MHNKSVVCYSVKSSSKMSQVNADKYEAYCQECMEVIDWDITEEEYEDDSELHLCTCCQKKAEDGEESEEEKEEEEEEEEE